MTTIVMLSGGVDSAYMLYAVLKDTKDPVIAHHVVLKKSHEPYWELELEATKKVVEYCKDIRDFEYVETVVDLCNLKLGAPDVYILIPLTAMISKRLGSCMILHGRPLWSTLWENTPEDRLLDYRVGRLERDLLNVLDPKSEMAFPLSSMTKREILVATPAELLDVTWSCRCPTDGNPCGKCWECRDRSTCDK